jgi:hypothetical protein
MCIVIGDTNGPSRESSCPLLAEGYRDPDVGLGSMVDVLESLESTYPRHIINIPRECNNCMIQSLPMSRAQRDAMSFHQTLAPPRPLISTD